MASSIPKHHIAPCYRIDISTQILIRAKYQFFILWKTINNQLRIRTCHHHIGQCLNRSCSVHIAHHFMVRIFLHKFGQVFGLTAISKRTTGIEITNKHFLSWTKNLICLAHEMYTTHNNNIRLRLCSPLSQSKRIAHKVGHILYSSIRIVMSKNYCILFLTYFPNFLSKVNIRRDRFINIPFL